MKAMKETKNGVGQYRIFIHGEWTDLVSGERIEEVCDLTSMHE